MNESKDTKEIETTHLLDKLSIGDVSGQSEQLHFNSAIVAYYTQKGIK